MRLTVEAFAVNPQTLSILEELKEDSRFRRSRFQVHEGGLAEAPGILVRVDSPQLLILESAESGDALLAELDTVADYVTQDTKVLVIGPDDSISLYRQLMGMGVADYLVSPPLPEDLSDAILRIASDDSDGSLAPLLAVMGVRGGVGSSSLACNLAYKLGRDISGEVCLVDLDISTGTSAVALNLSPRQSAADLLGQPEGLDQLDIERFLVRYDDHLLVLGSTAQLDVAFRPPSEALEAMLTVLRRQFDVVVLDVPRQWSLWVTDLLMDSSAVILTTYPDLCNLRDAQKMVSFLDDKRHDPGTTHMVLNKVGMAPKAELTGKDFEDVIGRAPVASLPFEPQAFGDALNNGEPVLSKKAVAKTYGKAFDPLLASLPLDLKPGTRASRQAGKGVLKGLFQVGRKGGRK